MTTETGRRRILATIAVQVVRNAPLASFLFCFAGVLGLMLLPALSRNVYVDENALLPGSARSTFEYADAVKARGLSIELLSMVSRARPDEKYRQFFEWLALHFERAGVDYYLQPFCPPTQSMSPFGFFISSHSYQCGTCEHPGINFVGIIRAPQGEGNEAIVLVTHFDVQNFTPENAMALALSVSLLQVLSGSPWLAKDIVWVAADSKYGNYTGVAAWLKEYYEPSVHQPSCSKVLNHMTGEFLGDKVSAIFRRAGSITAGFVVEIHRSSERENILQVGTEGSNGQMPNMDLISLVNQLVAWKQGFQLRTDEVPGLSQSSWLKAVGLVVEKFGKELAGLRKSFLKHKASFVTADQYASGFSTLVSSLSKQLRGVPTGSHGAFRDYQVDAVSLNFYAANTPYDTDLLLHCGRLVEDVLRSVNNLLEKLHHSLFLYVLVSPTSFVSISTYVIPFALLLVNFPIQAAALGSEYASSTQDWVRSISSVIMVTTWAVSCSVFPVLLPYLPFSDVTRLLLWMSSSSFLLLILDLSLKPSESPYWFVPLKASMLGLTGITLGVLSTVNFSVALFGCVLLVPMCLSTRPASLTWRSIWTGSPLRRVLALFLPFLTFWPLLVTLLVVRGNMLSLWSWTQSMWYWGSALYLFVFLVQLPCSVISLYIFIN